MFLSLIGLVNFLFDGGVCEVIPKMRLQGLFNPLLAVKPVKIQQPSICFCSFVERLVFVFSELQHVLLCHLEFWTAGQLITPCKDLRLGKHSQL